MERPDIRKKTVNGIDVMGIFHQAFQGPGRKEKTKNLVERGSLYPDITKDYDIILHETNFINKRRIPKEEGKRYYRVDREDKPGETKHIDLRMMTLLEREFNKPLKEIMAAETADDERKAWQIATQPDMERVMTPVMTEILGDMRDAIMAEKIKKIQEAHPGKKIGVFVGEGHLKGIARMIQNDAERKRLITEWEKDLPDYFTEIDTIEESDEKPLTKGATFFIQLEEQRNQFKQIARILEHNLQEQEGEEREKTLRIMRETQKKHEITSKVMQVIRSEATRGINGKISNESLAKKLEKDKVIESIFKKYPQLYEILEKTAFGFVS